MFHFEGHTLFIKKVMFPMKSGNFFKKITFMEVNFDSGICISMQYLCQRMYDLPTKFYTSNLNFYVKMGISGPLLSWDMPDTISSTRVFSLGGGWGVPPSGKNFANPPPHPTLVPVFGPRLVPPPQPRFVPENLKNLNTFLCQIWLLLSSKVP